MAGLCFGGDYHPEQWPEHVWHEDMSLMRQAGVNLVTVGGSAWSRLEPAEAEYDFGWLDTVLDLLVDNGVHVILAIPTGSPPPWFGMRHPDALPVGPDGIRYGHASRDAHCVAAPAFRTVSARLTRELAARYRHHPALTMWTVHNGYRTVCHCPHVARTFQEWLRERHGDLDGLNAAWSTSVWGQHYSDWPQVRPPQATTDTPNPAQLLDFRRFQSDEMLAHFAEQRTILRQYSPDVPVTTTFELGTTVPADHWRWSAEVDVVTVASFPDRYDRGAEEQTAFVADLARSWAGGGPWLLKEQSTGLFHTPRGPRNIEPGRLERHSMAHIARGSRGVMFAQWRAPRGGATAWRSAMLPHAGSDTRVFREVCRLGEMLPGLAELDGAGVRAPVGIVWDEPSMWALSGPGAPTPHLDYLEAVRQVHRVLWRHDVLADFVRPDADWSGYRLIVVPQLYLTDDAAADNLTGWVSEGGDAVVTYLSGVADPDGNIRSGRWPGALHAVLGVHSEEPHPLPPGEAVRLSNGATGRVWAEHLHTDGAEVLCGYRGGVLDRRPAITRHLYGSGRAWYVSTQLDDGDFTDLLAETGILPSVADPDIETIVRETEDDTYRIVINHGDKPTEVGGYGTDLVTGKTAEGDYRVPPGGFALLRLSTGRPPVTGDPFPPR
ncbi:beta-galactosidase [Stackebrandtia albiflava]|uniref:Beta-galactosidase n=1 Tax=Stackebrandtia albiflava TaxID=406432 RepID=A0A562UQ02_9ACTN|nr:beta-galactosidase [Stackebrandtia albiflava]